MLNFSLLLILAHLIGDFVLQPSSWIEHKKQFKIKSKCLYLHLFIHLLLLLIVTQFQSKYSLGWTIVIISHFVIDLMKIYLEEFKKSKKWFFVDQMLHFGVIAFVVNLYFPYQIPFLKLFETKALLLLISLTLLTYVSAIVIKIVLNKWDFKTENNNHDTNNAGTYIGMLERLFIFTFITINFWSGIGFLLAAKSIFRFGDLKESKDIKLTEYILVGTLLSFGTAILISLAFQKIIKLI